ncbi:MAG: VWA domain-containing protein [Magnetococcus sp. MYC-9]
MSHLHLLRPGWLLALLPLWWLVWQWIRPARDGSAWSRVCDPHLLPHILHHPPQGATRWAPGWVVLAGTLLVVAMAGPVWQKLPQPVFQSQSALVLLLDLSRSMEATDLKPSRLVRAKHKMMDLLRQRRGGQTAFLVFAGEAFVVTPLTHDTATITAQLSSLDTSLMPVQGSRPDRAVAKALELLQQGAVAHGQILVLTDGWVGEEQMATRVARAGHRLSILGAGTAEGAPIPLLDGGFLNDANGGILLAKLDEQHLQRLARLGGGVYQTMRNDDRDIEALQVTHADLTGGSGVERTELLADIWREEGPWLVLLVLPLAALLFRRGVFLLFLVLLLWKPGYLEAMEWQDLWQTPDQRAKQAFDAGHHQEAAGQFVDRAWRGAAHYRAGQYEQAVAEWQESPSTTALYNKGTALARLGRLTESAQAFQEVLRRQADHVDARFNLEKVQQAMPPAERSAARTEAQKKQDNQQQKEAGQPVDRGAAQADERPKQGEQQEHASAQGASKQTAPPPGGASPESTSARMADEQVGKSADAAALPGGSAQPILPGLREQEEQVKESHVATEQWLRRVPDDPGGLLRRKFRYQYQQEEGREPSARGVQPW